MNVENQITGIKTRVQDSNIGKHKSLETFTVTLNRLETANDIWLPDESDVIEIPYRQATTV